MVVFNGRSPGAMFLFAVILLLCFTPATGQDSNAGAATRPKDVIVIGALGIKGETALYDQWNDTFSGYVPTILTLNS